VETGQSVLNLMKSEDGYQSLHMYGPKGQSLLDIEEEEE
jgi:hypothetical protein